MSRRPLSIIALCLGAVLLVVSTRQAWTSNLADLRLMRLFAAHTAPDSMCSCLTGPSAARVEQPPSGTSSRNRGTAWLLLGDVARAQAEFVRAVQADRNDAPSVLRLSQIAAAAGDSREAARQLRNIRQADVFRLTDVGAAELRDGNTDEALKCFDIALAIDPDSANALHEKARVLMAKHDYDGGFRLLDRAASLCHTCAFVFLDRGWARQLRGELPDSVEADLRTALQLRPNDSNILFSWASWEIQRGRFDEAERTLTRLIAMFPDDARARETLRQLPAARARRGA
jgi:tetratricopeptide (TPR) repeat protein